MTATRISTLVALAALITVLSYFIFRTYYGSIPALPWAPCATIGLLALILGATARPTKRRIERRPGTEPVDPLVTARLVALAKAGAVVGAFLVGAWLGAFIYTLTELNQLVAAGHDAIVSGVGVVASVLLTVAALWLERSCKAPEPPQDRNRDRLRSRS